MGGYPFKHAFEATPRGVFLLAVQYTRVIAEAYRPWEEQFSTELNRETVYDEAKKRAPYVHAPTPSDFFKRVWNKWRAGSIQYVYPVPGGHRVLSFHPGGTYEWSSLVEGVPDRTGIVYTGPAQEFFACVLCYLNLSARPKTCMGKAKMAYRRLVTAGLDSFDVRVKGRLLSRPRLLGTEVINCVVKTQSE